MTSQFPPSKMQWPEHAIFTVGHSVLPIERFVGLLQAYDVKRLVDVRTIPRSRHNPQFNESALKCSLAAENIDYVLMAALGGLRRARQDSPNTGWRNASFRGYADYMLTQAFGDALETLIAMSREERTAIMCAEAVPWRCHRSLVADALSARGIAAIEILSETSWRIHKLTRFAQIDGVRVTYPPEQPTMI